MVIEYSLFYSIINMIIKICDIEIHKNKHDIFVKKKDKL